MGFEAVPITFLCPDAQSFGQESASQEEREIHMTNPQLHQPNPQVNPPINSHPPAPTHSALQDEIRLLRERGLSNECIHGLFSGFHIDANPAPSGQHWNLPSNDQLIRLIWGKIHPTPLHAE